MATLIVKATEKCNSNCYYCDVINKDSIRKTMSMDILEILYQRIGEFLLENTNQKVEILWHGGEPLLAGADFYFKAIDFQKKYCAQFENRITYNMQTNITLLKPSFIEIFRLFGLSSIGTSYDPEPGIRGSGNPPNTKKYNERFIKALFLLEESNIGWGLIYVVTKKSIQNPLKIFYFLTNLSLNGGFNMNPVLIYDKARKDIAITPEEFVNFLGIIFPIWWKNRKLFPNVQPFKSLVDNIIEGHTSLGCVDSGSCTYEHINIAPDGETSQCGRSADWGLLQYGNIKEKKLIEIIKDNQRCEFDERIKKLYKDDCKDCRFWEICHGGCPLDAFSQNKSFMHKSEWCDARRGFIENYFEPITGVKYKPKNRNGKIR